MAAAAAGIEQLEILERPRPSGESASGRHPLALAILDESEISELVAGQSYQLSAAVLGLALVPLGFEDSSLGPQPCRPPCADGVVEEKQHHVVLSKQLCDGWQSLARDLVAGGVNLIFALRLPELIDPAQAVLSGKDLDRQIGDEFLQRPFVLRREADLENGIIGPEYLRQHPGRVACRQCPTIWRTFVHGQLIALHQRDRHPFPLVNE